MLSHGKQEEMRQKIQTGNQFIENRLNDLFENLKHACENLEKEKCNQLVDELLNCEEVMSGLSFCLDTLASEEKDNRQKYVVGSLFLRDCFNLLLKEARKNDKESLVYVTGMKVSGLIILDRVSMPQLSEQSGVYVSVDHESSKAILCDLDKYGHGLHAWFHNHTSKGESATLPSNKDFATQERLERGGYDAVGAVFSEDGFVRFFSKQTEFKIEVFGKGVKKIEDFLFKIEETTEL
jgi:hypothetical protein